MNEINFNIEDIREITLSMDIATKEIYPPLEDLTIIPSREEQIFTHEQTYGYDNVIVNAISLQDKSLIINENGTHRIVADSEYSGLNQVNVTVEAIENLTDELATYNNELTEQETTIGNIINTLRGKGVLGSNELETSYISSIDNSLGANCTMLPNTVTSIRERAFYNCTNLSLRELPDSIITIGTSAFYGCANLEIAEIPASVTSIGGSAFRECTKLTSITVLGEPRLDAYVFYGCSNLTKFILPNVTKVITGGSSMFVDTPISTGDGYIYVPDNLVESYKNGVKWSGYKSHIKGISELEEI